MATVTRSTTWNSGDTLTASALNAEFNNLLNALAIVNADISGSANITFSKLDSSTVAGVTASQNLTNKTLTSPTLSGTVAGSPTFSGKPTFVATIPTIVADSDGATITFDMSAGNLHAVTLGGNRTLAVSNVATNQCFVVILKQGSGGQTVTWWSNIKWVGATIPTLTTTASRWDIFTFIYDGTNYYGSIYGQNFG